MDQLIVLASGLIVITVSCIGVVVSINLTRKFARRWTAVPAIWLESWQVAFELESNIAKRYAEHARDTDGWAAGGRLGEALREAEARYHADKVRLIREAEARLRLLDEQAKESGNTGLLNSVVETLAVQFPALGLILLNEKPT